MRIVINKARRAAGFGAKKQQRTAMYVCTCNGISDRDIQAAMDNGARTLDEVFDYLGKSQMCGQCTPDVRAELGLPADFEPQAA
jgi:bacterioferritin-associated ferredoxin